MEIKYLVGWNGKGQVVYGKETKGGNFKWADPMTLKQAKKLKSEFPKAIGRQKLVIFKLVPVK